MAEKYLAAMESYLNCPVCLNIFRDPTSLGCHHSFCSSCLNKIWDQAKNKNCPICKRKSSKDNPLVNFSLKELADLYAEPGGRKTRLSKDEVGSSGEGREEERSSEERREDVEVLCRKHTEEPTWRKRAMKEKLESDLQFLQDKQDKYKAVENTYAELLRHSKKQLIDTEGQMREEFEKLHQFLRKEEEARLAALREEEEQKRKTIFRELKIIQAQISSLTTSISAVEQDLQKEKVSFLATQNRSRTWCALPDPQLVAGVLIDVAKHLGNLTFRVWEKMMWVVKFTPVILDPNTAGRWLSLSDDMTCLRHTDTKQQLPYNPERFSNYADVLGSAGFSSGRHSWEVEVGDRPGWGIGVARESVDRKQEHSASPKDGMWCIRLRSGQYTNGFNETLPLKRRIQRIRVQLDCDSGEVSFYDPEDMSHIYTYKDTDTSTEKLYPCFGIGAPGDANHPDVKIVQSEMYVSVMSS